MIAETRYLGKKTEVRSQKSEAGEWDEQKSEARSQKSEAGEWDEQKSEARSQKLGNRRDAYHRAHQAATLPRISLSFLFAFCWSYSPASDF